MASNTVSARIDNLDKQLTALATEITGVDENARKKLLQVLKKQTMVVESPVEVIWRMSMEPHQHACLRTAIELRLTDHIVSASSITAEELVKLTNADKALIVRILRPLTCLNIFAEVGFETYSSTPISKYLTMPSISGSYRFWFDEVARVCLHMPTYLAQTSYVNPAGPNGCFQSAFSTSSQFFPWLVEHPEKMIDFNDFIVVKPVSRTEWYDFVPIEKLLLDGYVEGTVLMIDVGGNRGLNLEGFKRKLDQHTKHSKLVLQDLPEVIDDIKELDENILRMPHNFMTPQPLIGARSYYLRYILHDHSDAVCRTILSHLVAAMRQDYSKLLIFEYVLPDVGAALFPSLLDITMLALLNGMERTETQWKKLLASVGLEDVRFWYNGDDKNHEAMIEAKLEHTDDIKDEIAQIATSFQEYDMDATIREFSDPKNKRLKKQLRTLHQIQITEPNENPLSEAHSVGDGRRLRSV